MRTSILGGLLCGLLCGLLALPGAVLGCTSTSRTEPAAGAEDLVMRQLPSPREHAGPGVWSTIASRRSQRSYGPGAVADVELAQILWAAQGTRDGRRTVPSAGALYPLTVHVADAGGIWTYLPDTHALRRVHAADHRARLAHAALDQTPVQQAALVLVITAELAVTARKYGAAAERFATLEAGHAAQNILLATTALDLAAVPVGAFHPADVLSALALTAAHTPLYLIPIGRPPGTEAP